MKYAWIYSLLIHIIVPQVWRADPTLPEAHRSQALQMQSVWAEFRQVGPPRPPHEEAPIVAVGQTSAENSGVQRERCPLMLW